MRIDAPTDLLWRLSTEMLKLLLRVAYGIDADALSTRKEDAMRMQVVAELGRARLQNKLHLMRWLGANARS